MEKIKAILEKYNEGDAKEFKATIEMLCNKGIANGCYQDYTMLADVIDLLYTCESIIRGNK